MQRAAPAGLCQPLAKPPEIAAAVCIPSLRNDDRLHVELVAIKSNGSLRVIVNHLNGHFDLRVARKIVTVV